MSAHPPLDDPDRLSSLDRHGAGRILIAFPSQCREALALTASPPLPPLAVRHLVVAGMGGSAVGGDLVAALARDWLPVPVTVWRGYGAPASLGPGTLLVAVSYSGTTEETISTLEAALRRGATGAVVTSGGALATLARERGLPLVRVPAGLFPRLALGYLFFPLLGVLESAGLRLTRQWERDEALRVLEVMGAELGPERPEAQNEAKRLALSLNGRIPVIYGSVLTEVAAYRWKTEVEENAKLLAFHGRLPEADHNEVEGWRDPLAAGFHAVFLRDPEEDEVAGSRVRVTGELIRAHAGGVTEVWPRGQGRLAQLFSLIYLGDWVSYYLGLLRGVDPGPVPVIEEVKRRLREGKSP